MTTAPSTTSTSASPVSADIVDELASTFRATAESVVPWFVSQMPPMYFQDTDRASQLAHLRAIIAAKASDRPIDLTLKSEDGRQLTLIKNANYPGVLAELVAQLPMDRSLRAAKIHSSFDGKLVLDTFVFGDPNRSTVAIRASRPNSPTPFATPKSADSIGRPTKSPRFLRAAALNMF